MSKLQELEQPYLELFKHVVKYFDDPTTEGLIYISSIRTIAERGFNVGLVRSGLNWLTEHGFLSPLSQSTTGDICWELSDKGSIAAFELIAAANEAVGLSAVSAIASTSHSTIPASDRFVSLGDNEPEREHLVETLDELANAVRGDNQLFANPDERLAVQAEISSLTDALKASRIRSVVLTAAVSGTGILTWLADKAAGSVVGNLAMTALRSLKHLCQSKGLL